MPSPEWLARLEVLLWCLIDTAPTGHSLLLMDATVAYHRQMMRELEGQTSAKLVTPLMRLQDPRYTKIIWVALPEVTPVSQAQALQDDLRRVRIEPFPWVVCQQKHIGQWYAGSALNGPYER